MTAEKGRPTKYKPIYDGLLIELSAAKRLNCAVVYGLCDRGGTVFYIGKTTNPKRRFASHSERATRNAGLRAKLDELGDDVRVAIVDWEPKDLNAAERQAIASYAGQIVNLIGVGHWSWAANSAVPWAAGTGILAPSAYALMTAKGAAKKEARARIAGMSTADRCKFELSLLQSYPPPLRKRFDKWLSVAAPKMATVLAAA